jgi:hypothetical protein
MNHSYMDPRLRAFRQFFVVPSAGSGQAFAEPSVSAQPTQGALHNPPAGQHLKAMTVHGSLDHRNQLASHVGSPIRQLSGAKSNPRVSTTIWRLRPFTFLPAS